MSLIVIAEVVGDYWRSRVDGFILANAEIVKARRALVVRTAPRRGLTEERPRPNRAVEGDRSNRAASSWLGAQVSKRVGARASVADHRLQAGGSVFLRGMS